MIALEVIKRKVYDWSLAFEGAFQSYANFLNFSVGTLLKFLLKSEKLKCARKSLHALLYPDSNSLHSSLFPTFKSNYFISVDLRIEKRISSRKNHFNYI